MKVKLCEYTVDTKNIISLNNRPKRVLSGLNKVKKYKYTADLQNDIVLPLTKQEYKYLKKILKGEKNE